MIRTSAVPFRAVFTPPSGSAHSSTSTPVASRDSRAIASRVLRLPISSSGVSDSRQPTSGATCASASTRRDGDDDAALHVGRARPVGAAVAHGQRPLGGGAGRPHGVVVARDQRARARCRRAGGRRRRAGAGRAARRAPPRQRAGRRRAPASRAAPGSRRRAARASREHRTRRSPRRGRRGRPWKRPGASAASSASRSSPRASRSTHTAVTGAIVMPSIAWPAAMMTRSLPGARPTIGMPSAVTGRGRARPRSASRRRARRGAPPRRA